MSPTLPPPVRWRKTLSENINTTVYAMRHVCTSTHDVSVNEVVAVNSCEHLMFQLAKWLLLIVVSI